MSSRGVKAASVAKGGTDGMDFSHRQVLAPRYEQMASYRTKLVTLFSVLPFFYLTIIVLTAIHFNAKALKPISIRFLPPFLVQVVGLIATAVFALRSIQLQSSTPWMVLSSIGTLFVIFLSVVYTQQVISPVGGASDQIGHVWYLLGAVVTGLIVLLNVFSVYAGYMIKQLQGSPKRK